MEFRGVFPLRRPFSRSASGIRGHYSTSWLDLDKQYGGLAGPFEIVGAGGTTTLDTSTSIFTLGSSLTAVNLGIGNTFTDGIESSGNGNWYDAAIQFDLASTPISSLTLVSTTDWIAPTGTMTLQVVPVPATILLGFIGLGVGGWKLRKSI